jgi:pyruvate,orthophosphate dikinase
VVSNSFGKWIIGIDANELPARELIGGKAWSIARMNGLGLNVPPAIVITTQACSAYLATGALPAGLLEELKSGIHWLEQKSGRTFGGGPSPLLVSVRSGAAISMPGMMDTVLNLGINEVTEKSLGIETGSPEFAHDTHRRFLELFASIVLKATVQKLDNVDNVLRWHEQINSAAGRPLPDSADQQLQEAIVAIFESSHSRRARRYRKHHGLPENLGTAVTIQAMVFGNLDNRSGTGVLFSRNPLTGDPAPYGEYLDCAQGEDVVSGKFTPQPLTSLRDSAPVIYDELIRASGVLEQDAGDVQDIEFTVQRGELFLLQARAAKRAPLAAMRFAVDLVADGLIDTATALSRVTSEQVRTLLQPRLAADAADGVEILASGEPACHGIGIGTVVTNADEAERRAAALSVVLARSTTSPEDLHGMIASCAVITDHGGSTSHAAVVSRALGVPCIVGCGAGSVVALDGRLVTVDGTTGRIYAGELALETPSESDYPELQKLAQWARELCPIEVLQQGDRDLPEDVLDLNLPEGGEDPAQFARLIGTAKAVSGRALESDDGVEAALDAGVECIISEQNLSTMLCAIHYRAQAGGK